MTSIASLFAKLHHRIQPGRSELERLDKRYQTIRRKLLDVFPSARVSKMGSLSRGTGIKATSDLDVLLEVTREDVRWGGGYTQSSAILRRVRDVLKERYPSTAIGVRGPAVVAEFGQGRPLEIVPSVFDGFEGGTKVIAIPDGRGGWMATSPQAHGRFIGQQNDRAGGKLKATAQYIKYWRYTRATPLPVQSFFVEMTLAVEGTCEGAKSYSQCVADAFEVLVDMHDFAVADPLGISDGIFLTNTAAQKQQVLGGLMRSAEQALKAVEAERRGNIRDAIEWWDKVFKGNFPKR